MNDVQKGVAGAALAVLVFAGAVLAVRLAYGTLDDPYSVTSRFPRAGQGLIVGSDVTLRGVPVGEVGAIDLVDREVDIRLDITDDQVRIPTDATATVRPKTLFGEKEIALDFEPGSDGPFVEDDGRLPDGAGRVGTEVEGLIDSTDILLRRIDEDQVATIITELANAVDGQGENIRAQFDSGVRLMALLADTIDAQLVSLDSTAELTGHLADAGDDLNRLNASLNAGLPTLNAARADYERFLDTLRPFTDELARVLSQTRPDFVRMLEDGDNIMRVLLARQPELAETLHGLGDYFHVFANGVGDEVFEDGTRFVYFAAFAKEQEIEELICGLLNASTAPEVDAIVGALAENSPIDCPGAPASASGQTSTPASADAGGNGPLPPAGQELLDELSLEMAEPDQTVERDVGALLDRWLGGDR